MFAVWATAGSVVGFNDWESGCDEISSTVLFSALSGYNLEWIC